MRKIKKTGGKIMNRQMVLKLGIGGLIALLLIVVLFNHFEAETEELKVLTTYSIIDDLVSSVAGDRIETDYIVPLGAEPEEFEPLPENMQQVDGADLIIYNGLGIERWLENLINNVNPEQKMAKATEGIEPFYLDEGSFQGTPDPHAWFDPILVKDFYLPNIRDALIDLDPANEEYYRERTKQQQKKLLELHYWIEDELEALAREDRVLVSSEGAFRYFCEAYEFEEGFIWQINAHEEGTPQQIADLVDLIRDRDVGAVFVETSVDHRPMKQVAEETDIPIGGELYSDSLGEAGSSGETYLKLMEHNVSLIVESLKE